MDRLAAFKIFCLRPALMQWRCTTLALLDQRAVAILTPPDQAVLFDPWAVPGNFRPVTRGTERNNAPGQWSDDSFIETTETQCKIKLNSSMATWLHTVHGFIKANVSVKREEMLNWLSARGDEWINIDVKEARSGKWYAAVDNWQPNADAAPSAAVTASAPSATARRRFRR